MGRTNQGVNVYEYYRLLPWYAAREGFGFICFWAYNASSPNDQPGASGRAAAVVYPRNGVLHTSRRWELFREGMEDYALLSLRYAANERLLIPDTHQALDEMVRHVTDSPDQFDRADEARSKILNELRSNRKKQP